MKSTGLLSVGRLDAHFLLHAVVQQREKKFLKQQGLFVILNNQEVILFYVPSSSIIGEKADISPAGISKTEQLTGEQIALQVGGKMCF